MKRGQPKCICSPNCKASTPNRKVGGGGIEVIQLPQMKKNKSRQYSVIRQSDMQSDEPTLIIASGRGRNSRQKFNQSNINTEASVINTVRSLMLPQNATVDDVARSIEMKFRSGSFNDVQFTPSLQSEFYFGNVVSFSQILFSISFNNFTRTKLFVSILAQICTLQSRLWKRW